MIKIAFDAFGGDHGPEVLVAGALKALDAIAGNLILTGDEPRLTEILGRQRYDPGRVEIAHAPDVVGMDAKPKDSLKLKQSSIAVAVDLVKSGAAAGVVSAGNTGASAAQARIKLRTLEGIQTPAISTFFPTLKNPCFLLDVGATVDCKPQHYLQFGLMGSVYAREVLGIDNPRVGLLNIGAEETKGNEAALKAHQLLKHSSLNFAGNAEGNDILSGEFDVVVMDGFVGNVVLKFGSSTVRFLQGLIKSEIRKNPVSILGGLLARPAFNRVAKRLDKSEWGGAPLLGVNGNCIIAHGSSDERAIYNAVRRAEEMITQNVNRKILQALTENRESLSGAEILENVANRI